MAFHTALIIIFSGFWRLSSSGSCIKQAIRYLSSSKCVGLGEIHNLIIKGYSEIFTSVLSYIFNLSSLKVKFLSLWKQPACVPVFKKGNIALVTNWPIKMIYNFPKYYNK